MGKKGNVSSLLYADDIALLGIHQILKKVNQCVKAVGLCMNSSKTKTMDSHSAPDAQRPITL